MARFLKHVACPKCGSSDANAIYDDGSQFCFSCRKPTGSKVSPYVTNHMGQDSQESEAKEPKLPDDSTQDYSQGAVAWAAKYEIPVGVLLRENVVYSAKRDQLIYPWYSPTGSLLAYQARNLSAENKARRYFTQGDVNELLPIYIGCQQAECRRLVLVEDCLSAFKVAYTEGLGAHAMPLLGNNISKEKLTRLRILYDKLYIFLDGDMYPNALKISKQAQLIGFETKVVYSEKDPKEHDKKSLTSLLI